MRTTVSLCILVHVCRVLRAQLLLMLCCLSIYSIYLVDIGFTHKVGGEYEYEYEYV